ncbi:MAG TPA: serine/threonine-protein kinase, partial [Myxococcaceae bacterium]|nr:serine/threonine-protein kinase [Myxococcaceae bacterium]
MVGPAVAAGTEVSSPRLQVGDVLVGRFQVTRFIAQGGMGAVYEASDSLLKTRVALKVIRGISADAGALERFRREVLLARRVSHPNVCRVYELYEGTTSTGAPILFLTMELLEGESLGSRLARTGRLTTDEALPLVRQMCEGLAAAHAEGVVHRDFKSSNVMLVPRAGGTGEATTASTRVVITDFGVARAVHLVSEEAEEEPLTGRAGILGTPEYMAPEQVTGGEVTAASDIYALGVVLYEMVTGKLPFVGDTPLAAAARRLDEAPPRPDASLPGLDKRWAEAILRCLARQPERRFKSARDVIPAIERLPGHRRRTRALAWSAVVVVLLGAFALVRYRPSLRPRAPERSTVLSAPRLLVAVLGFRNELPSPKLKWLPTAVTELLVQELAAAEQSLRVSDPEELNYRGLRSLGVSESMVGEEKEQRRLAAVLGADVLVHGTLTPPEPGSDAVHLHVEALDAETRMQRASVDVDLGSGATRLLEALPDLGARLREALGASLSTEEEAALSASLPRNLDAAQAYAEGIVRLYNWEGSDARSHFEAALTASPGFLDPQRRIAQSWEFQGDLKAAREAWQRVRARSDGLTTRGRAMVEATLLGLEPDGQKAHEAWIALFEAMPDDIDTAWQVIGERMSPATLELMKRV